MRRWSWYLSGRKALSRTTRGWWAGVTEAIFSAALILVGVIWLAVTVTIAALGTSESAFYQSMPYLVLQMVLAITMIGLGTYLVVISLWKVSASAERRGALVNKANEFEILNDLRGQQEKLPNVPSDTIPPGVGVSAPFRLRASRKNFWGLIGAAAVWLVFMVLAVIFVIIGYDKFQLDPTDWYASGLAVPFSIASIWSFYYFVRQLLKLTSIGPTVLEISDYPIIPGIEYKVLLSQAGRLRIKLLDVNLECYEEATFDQGTNIRTERQTVFSQRLLRRRGVRVEYQKPFQDEFILLVPFGAMHSFQSASNRIQWKIEICGQAKGFPLVKRSFEIVVLPPANGTDPSPEVPKVESA